MKALNYGKQFYIVITDGNFMKIADKARRKS